MSKWIRFCAYFSLFSLTMVSCSSMNMGTSFKVESPKKVVLENGLKVRLYEDRSLPYLSFYLLIKTGSAEDSMAQSGTAAMMSHLLDKGTANLSAEQLANRLESIGATFSQSVDHDFIMLSAQGLSFYHQELTDLFSEIVLRPSFKKTEMNRIKRRWVQHLDQMVENPSGLASLMYNRYFYGEHPYARSSFGTKRDIKMMKRKNIFKYYLKYIRPNNAELAVVGRYPKSLIEDLNKKFKKWKNRTAARASFPSQSLIEETQVLLVNGPRLSQAHIVVGQSGVVRKSKDYLALKVINTILGGTFTSRLMSDVRAKKGLTYSISANLSSRKNAGALKVTTFTRVNKVKETLEAILQNLKNLGESGVTAEELAKAKAYLKGSFPRQLQTAESLAKTQMLLSHYSVEKSYLSDYIENLESLTLSEVNRVVREHWKQKKFKILVYGPKKKLLPQLRSFGIVKVKSYRDYL